MTRYEWIDLTNTGSNVYKADCPVCGQTVVVRIRSTGYTDSNACQHFDDVMTLPGAPMRHCAGFKVPSIIQHNAPS